MNFLKKFMKDDQPTWTSSVPVEVDNDQAESVARQKPTEHYRVGVNSEGMTTLTLMSGYNSMTLTMSKGYCEQLIKMLRSTYDNLEEKTVE